MDKKFNGRSRSVGRQNAPVSLGFDGKDRPPTTLPLQPDPLKPACFLDSIS
jgi:hypothetical protein